METCPDLPGRGLGSKHMVQILSYTRRPTTHTHTHIQHDVTARQQQQQQLTESERTESVEDVGDEDKLAGVELDHRCVGQKFGALERTSQVSVFDPKEEGGVCVCVATWMTIFRALTFWSEDQASFRDWLSSSMRLA